MVRYIERIRTLRIAAYVRMFVRTYVVVNGRVATIVQIRGTVPYFLASFIPSYKLRARIRECRTKYRACFSYSALNIIYRPRSSRFAYRGSRQSRGSLHQLRRSRIVFRRERKEVLRIYIFREYLILSRLITQQSRYDSLSCFFTPFISIYRIF